MNISIPKLSLVVLVGPSGSGKSTFARKHFLATEILSSDDCRGMVSDDANNQAVTNDAFEVLHFVAAKRLALGRLTVIDATIVQPEARAPLVALARQFHVLPVAIVRKPCPRHGGAGGDEPVCRQPKMADLPPRAISSNIIEGVSMWLPTQDTLTQSREHATLAVVCVGNCSTRKSLRYPMLPDASDSFSDV